MRSSTFLKRKRLVSLSQNRLLAGLNSLHLMLGASATSHLEYQKLNFLTLKIGTGYQELLRLGFKGRAYLRLKRKIL